MSNEFQREYLVRVPLPLAQLYSRAHNAKDGRGQHDNCFYLFEALVKLAGCPLIAAYIEELRRGGEHVDALDRLLLQLALPSLGQWVGILRELARHFGERPDAASQPMGHLWQQLSTKRRDLEGILALFRRIKNGPDGKPAGDQSCSIMQLIDGLVQYRNAVFGHGAGRVASFYEEEMGPLMFPAVNDVLAEGVLDLLGPRGSRLVYLTEIRTVGHGMSEVGVRELVGLQGERSAPLTLEQQYISHLVPERMAILWPGRRAPMLLDPLLIYREGELTEDVLFLNRDRNGKQVEYLSYATGQTQRDKAMAPAMAQMLGTIAGKEISEEGMQELRDKSISDIISADDFSTPAQPKNRVLGDFEILAELGRGGMGVVYLARQLSLGRLVALKMLPAELAGNEVALARFRREMRALGRCEHPNIVKVISCGTLPDGELYYAMEYVPGADLEQTWIESSETHRDASVSDLTGASFSGAVLSASHKLRKKTLEKSTTAWKKPEANQLQPDQQPDQPEPTIAHDALPLPPLPDVTHSDQQRGGYARMIARIMRDAALALQAVHDQHIVHRDVKPANLMLTPDGSRVVLMDFGLAKGDDLTGAATEAGGFMGTLRYSAPEQLAAASLKIGPQADVRGLGVTLWELLTRQKIFADCQDEVQLAQAVHERDVPRLRSVDPNFDKDLEAIVARATERRSPDRIQTARELAGYLDLYLEGKPLPIRTPGLAELLGRWVRGHKALVATIAAALVVVVATVTVAFVMITNSLHKERLAKDEATQHFRMAQDAVDEWLIDVNNVMQYYPGLNGTREQLLNKAAAEYEDFTKKQTDDVRLQIEFAKSYIRLGDVRARLGQDKKAKQAFEAAKTEFEELAASSPDNPEIQQQLANSYTGLGMHYGQAEQYQQADEAYDRSLAILDQLLSKAKDDAKIRDAKARNLNSHAYLFEQRGQFDEAERLLRDAVAEFKAVAESTGSARYQRRLLAAQNDLTRLLQRKKEYGEIVEISRTTVRGYEKLLAADPGHPEHQYGIASAQLSLAFALRETDPRAALPAYADGIASMDKLAKQNPTKLHYFEDLATLRLDRAQILYDFGQNQEAGNLALAALQTYSYLMESTDAAAIPLNYHEGIAANLQLLGEITADLGIDDQAQQYFDSAITGKYEMLVDQFKKNKDYRIRLAGCRAAYGRFLHRLGRLDEAQAAYSAAIQALNELGSGSADNADLLARLHTYQGDAFLQLGKALEAKSAYRTAITLREQLPKEAKNLNQLARLLADCSDDELRDRIKAVLLAREVCDKNPAAADYWNTLGLACYRAGQWDESLQALDEAQKHRFGDDSSDHFLQAMAYWQQQNKTEAQASFDRGIELMDMNRPGQFDAIRLRREAAELLGATTP